jgi:hypothetical protein
MDRGEKFVRVTVTPQPIDCKRDAIKAAADLAGGKASGSGRSNASELADDRRIGASASPAPYTSPRRLVDRAMWKKPGAAEKTLSAFHATLCADAANI